MIYDFDKKVDRTGTGSVKFDGLKEYFGKEKLLPMWVADMDFEVPPRVVESIKKRADHGIFGYTLVTRTFYDAISGWMRLRHGWEVRADWIVFSPGIVPALTMSVMTYTSPGDRVLLQSPVYPPFFSSIKDNGRELVNNRLREDNGRYTIDFDDLEAKLADNVKMMFFCNPHNPVGRVWTGDEIGRVVSLCRQYDVILISDEIHSDLIFSGHRHVPAVTVAEGKEKIAICMAPSKTFNLAGLATAFLIIPDRDLRTRMKKMVENLHVHYGNVFGLVALQAAYEHGSEWLGELMKYLQSNRETVTRFFMEELPEIVPVETEGTYLMWLDCRKTGMNDRELKRFFTGRARVAMNPGPAFGPGGEGFFRMNIACPRSTLTDALGRIKEAWQQG